MALKPLQIHNFLDTLWGYIACPFLCVDLCENGKKRDLNPRSEKTNNHKEKRLALDKRLQPQFFVHNSFEEHTKMVTYKAVEVLDFS